MTRSIRLLTLALLGLSLDTYAQTSPPSPVTAAAKTAPTYNAQDPFEPVNRKIFGFNLWVDRHAIRPVTTLYHSLLPNPVRGAIGGVFAELAYPSVMLNDLLQGLPTDFVADTARLVVNGSVGLAGIWDPATRLGLPSHKRDFGQTLGKYGVPMGPYIMLPILGPDLARDLPSEFVDRYSSADWHIKQNNIKFELGAARMVSRRDELLAADPAIDNAFDPYVSVRDAYIQKRAYLVKGDRVESTDEDLPALEDLDPEPATGVSPQSASPQSGSPQ